MQLLVYLHNHKTMKTKKIVKKAVKEETTTAISDIIHTPFFDVDGEEKYVKKCYSGTKLVSEEIVNEIK